MVGCSSLEKIKVNENNKTYCDVDGVLFSKDKKTLLIYPPRRKGNYSVPDSVTSIGYLAFYGCHSLIIINIPDRVTYIGNGAFRECESLKSINIPNGVISIETDAFVDMNVYDLIVMFRNKDFSVKMNHHIKYRDIAEYYLHTSDLDAEIYIKKNSLKFIKFVIENFSANDFCFFLQYLRHKKKYRQIHNPCRRKRKSGGIFNSYQLQKQNFQINYDTGRAVVILNLY